MIVYFDTSALVKAYVPENGSDAIRTILAYPHLQPGSLCLLEVEMAAALGKAVRLFRLDEVVLRRTWQMFLEDWSAFAQIRISDSLVHRAADLAIERSFRGYDRDLWQAAQETGLTPWPEDRTGVGLL